MFASGGLLILGVIGLLQGLLVKWETRSSVHPSPQRMKPLQRLKSINSRQQNNTAVQHLRVERANRNQNHTRSWLCVVGQGDVVSRLTLGMTGAVTCLKVA